MPNEEEDLIMMNDFESFVKDYEIDKSIQEKIESAWKQAWKSCNRYRDFRLERCFDRPHAHL